VQTGETHFNEKWAAIIGYTLDEISPVSIETWQRFADPEDLQRSEQLLGAHFNGDTEGYEIEARMRHKHGQWVWVLDRGKVATWTEDGKPEWVFGTHQEITDRKRLEEKHIALGKAGSALQACSAESINYTDITKTAQRLSGATFAALNLFDSSHITFATQAITGLPEYIQKAEKLLGHPIVGRTWDYDPDKEVALGDNQTTVFPSLGALASRSLSATIANKIAGAFHVGEVAVVRITTADDTQGNFTLFFSEGAHLQDENLVETHASMVGITLRRIETERRNTSLVAEKETLLKEVL
jgi:PAS domain S-box-containing protein